MAGDDTKPVQEGDTVDQLAARRRQRDRGSRPAQITTPRPSPRSAPRLVDSLPDEPYNLLEELFDETTGDPVVRTASSADDALDGLDELAERPAAAVTQELDDAVEEDQIGAQLHRYHEFTYQPSGPRTPRGSAELSAETAPRRPARPARRRAPKPDRAKTTAAGQPTRSWWRRGGVGAVAAIVASVVAVIAVVAITTNSPGGRSVSHATSSPSSSPVTVTNPAPSAVMSRVGGSWHDLSIGAHQTAKSYAAARQAQHRRERAAARKRAKQAHKRRAQLRHHKAAAAAAAAAQSSSSPASSAPTETTPSEPTETTPNDSYDSGSSSESYTPPPASPSSDAGSGSGSSGSSSSQPAGPTGIVSGSGCDPKCS